MNFREGDLLEVVIEVVVKPGALVVEDMLKITEEDMMTEAAKLSFQRAL